MRLTFLVPEIHERPTGGNIYNRRILAELRQHVSVDVIAWSAGSAPRPNPAPASSQAIIVDSLLLQYASAIRSLRETLDDAKVVLLAHYLHCIDPNEQRSAQASRERSLLPLFDGALAPSRFARRALTDENVPPERVGVVPPGLDAAYRESVRKRIATDPPELLTVSNLLPGKGLLSLVEELSNLDDLRWQWTLVGDDTLEPEFAETVRTRVRETRITGRVELTGVVDPSQIRSRYDDADIFVLPSRFETCSMATREAMARGLPVVGYEVGGLSENFGDTTAGVLADPDTPSDLSDALRRLLINPDERRRMSAAARGQSQTFPSWSAAADRFLSFLHDLT